MKIALLLSATCLALCSSYKMLMIAPSNPPSQIMFNTRVAKALTDAGHDVTITIIHAMNDFDHAPVKIPENVKVRHVNSSGEEDMKQMEEEVGGMIFEEPSIFDSKNRKLMSMLMNLFQKSCRRTLQNKEFMKWLIESKFDLAFVHMYHTCPAGLAHIADIPFIWLHSDGLVDYLSEAVGVPMPPSYVPPMLMASQDRMNFYERIKSFLGHSLSKIILPWWIINPETEIFREEWDPNFPHLWDIARNCNLLMANTHAFYELPRPTLAKVVQIGGIGAQLKDAKPLPEELEKFVQEGEGAIVLTFGSVAPINKAPEKWKNAILKSFARFPNHRFIMRYMGDDLDDRLPPNLKIMKWLPQSDLLQHPRVKAFISHGGYNGFQETIAAGKPIIMIPLAGDQPRNAKIAEKHGIAVVVQKGEMSEEKLYGAIKEILSNPSYFNTAQRLSSMVAKTPVPAEQLLVKWSELLAEFKSLDNLKPAGQELNFFQYHSLDVMAFLLIVTLVFLFVSYRFLRLAVRWVWRCVAFKKDKKE